MVTMLKISFGESFITQGWQVNLRKHNQMEWCRAVVKGEQEVDTQKEEPENNKLADLDHVLKQSYTYLLMHKDLGFMHIVLDEPQYESFIGQQC
ncbi:Protein BOBBER 2 [Carex littledalei]|uniref:Protein BOBBER 2 n=1 Tax=Carex littledalei TaxID=544730 RepID=A0A833QYV8_9POAL|nr:Protein BOBBER 2 [Carex littledalei]